MTDDFEEVSPLVTALHPYASYEEKKLITVELRVHIAALYKLYCRWDAEGLLDDEPEPKPKINKFESGVVSIIKQPSYPPLMHNGMA